MGTGQRQAQSQRGSELYLEERPPRHESGFSGNAGPATAAGAGAEEPGLSPAAEGDMTESENTFLARDKPNGEVPARQSLVETPPARHGLIMPGGLRFP